MEEKLLLIRDFADKAHGEQMRRYTGDRYIVHPVRVMENCRKYSDDITVLAAALLHDVLEDTAITKAEILNFLNTIVNAEQVKRTLELVEDLTDIYTKQAYPQWNRRKRKDLEAERLSKINGDAQTIKYADIIDNAPEITQEEPDFANRYLNEYDTVLHKMNKGNPELYREAVSIIKHCKQLMYSQRLRR